MKSRQREFLPCHKERHLYFQCLLSGPISYKMKIAGGIEFRLFSSHHLSSLCFCLLLFCLPHSTFCTFSSFCYQRGLVQQGRIIQLKLKSINQSLIHVSVAPVWFSLQMGRVKLVKISWRI